ncbi:MAG: hypothetical protein MUC71_01740 [Steroidobacteraceae bacterium]|nr:hypothetical protein [Steroidobacteraceae bacterium]
MRPDTSVSRRLARRLAAAGLALGAMLPAGAASAATITVTARSIEAGGVAARDFALRLAPAGPQAAALSLQAATVEGLGALGLVERVSLDCRTLTVRDGAARCEGRATGRFGRAGLQDTPIRIDAEGSDRGRLRLERLTIAGGEVGADISLRGQAWTAEAAFAGVALDQARALAGDRLPLPDGFSLAGSAGGTLHAAGRGGDLRSAEGRLSIRDVDLASADGTLASEKLAAEIGGRVEAAARDAGLGFELEVASASGQAYVEPWFADFAEHPVEARLAGRLSPDAATVEIDRLEASQAGVASVSGRGRLDLGGGPLLAALSLELRDVDLASAVPLFLQPPLVSTPFKDLGGAGRVRGEIELAAGLPTRIALELTDVALSSATGGVSVEGLEGSVSWFDDATRNALGPLVDSAVFKSLVGWRAAKLWGLEIGGAELPFTTTGRHFRLLDPVFIPVFDGGIAVETIRLRHGGTPQMYLRFDAEVRPISVALIGRALGWPEFSGSVSGRIPRLEMADGFVTLGGNLEATVFDGTVTVRDLKLRDPLGPFPQLQAAIDVDRLDLQYVTNTFEFGLITGRLSGGIEGLELFDWTPLRFDARLASTPGDRTPRRISQRAVANLSSIGGGSGGTVTAALQSGFLRFFKTFRYRELGLSCRLENDVCTMDGVGPAPGGYYIVRGSGLPRIDVIGNQRRVAWTRLVRQLAAMTQGGELIIE